MILPGTPHDGAIHDPGTYEPTQFTAALKVYPTPFNKTGVI
jgi:hypothetical protein